MSAVPEGYDKPETKEEYRELPDWVQGRVSCQGLPDKYAVPPKSELEGMGIDDVEREFGVSDETAAGWLMEHGLYEPDRERPAPKGSMSSKLEEMDPEDLGLGGDGDED